MLACLCRNCLPTVTWVWFTWRGINLTSSDQNYLPRKIGNIRVYVKYFLPEVTHGLVLRKKEYIDEVIVRWELCVANTTGRTTGCFKSDAWSKICQKSREKRRIDISSRVWHFAMSEHTCAVNFRENWPWYWKSTSEDEWSPQLRHFPALPELRRTNELRGGWQAGFHRETLLPIAVNEVCVMVRP